MEKAGVKAKVETKTTGTLDRGEALTRDRRLKRGTGTVPSRQSFKGNLMLPDAPLTRNFRVASIFLGDRRLHKTGSCRTCALAIVRCWLLAR